MHLDTNFVDSIVLFIMRTLINILNMIALPINLIRGLFDPDY